MTGTLEKSRKQQEELIAELLGFITDLKVVSFDNIDALKFKFHSDGINYQEINDLISKRKFQTAILHCYLEINRIKEDHIGDFIKLHDIVKLGNLVGEALFEMYKYVDGFRTTVAKSELENTPFLHYITPARKIIEFVLELDPNEISNQYLYAKLLFESFKLEQISIDEVENAYLDVIETAKRDYEITNEDDNYLLYQSHLQLANVFSYASLQDRDLYETVFSHYNEAYRYGQRNNIDTGEIFDNVKKLTRLINGEFPLYALIYSALGHSIYQYMFEEVKFAPIRDSVGFNLSSLFAARESALQEIFNIKTNQSLLEAEDYVIVQNTLGYSQVNEEGIFLMLVFANMNKSRSLRDLANFYEPVIEKVKNDIMSIDENREYIEQFKGMFKEDINQKINWIIRDMSNWIDDFVIEEEDIISD